MKKVYVILCLRLAASASFAEDAPHVVRWQNIVGVITAQGVDNPVSENIHSGTFAWSTRSGFASVDLTSGVARFHVEGLVINGTSFSGTPGPVPAVTGTLVCNAGTNSEVALNTAAALDERGNAQFSSHISNIPANCGNRCFC